jgi:hypothetical protein
MASLLPIERLAQEDRKEEEEKRELTCEICRGLLNKPLRFSACNHHFCQACLNRWFESREENDFICPFDRTESWLMNGEEWRTTKIREGIKFTCREKEFGCPEELPMNEILRHQLTCKYKVVICPRGCEELRCKKDLYKHLAGDCDVKINERIRREMCAPCAYEYFHFCSATHCDPEEIRKWIDA